MNMKDKAPIFRVKATDNTEEAKDKAKLMDALFQRMIPRSRQLEIVRESMMHVMTCSNSNHVTCQGIVEIKWGEHLDG